MAACKGRVRAGNYAVASIVHSSVASDDEDSFGLQVASTAVANAAVAEADSGVYAAGLAAVVARSSADAAATETQTRCPEKVHELLAKID